MRKFYPGAYVWYGGEVCTVRDCEADPSTNEEVIEVYLHWYDADGYPCFRWVAPSEVKLLLPFHDLKRLALQVHEATPCP